MLAAKSSSVTTGVYSRSRPASARVARACGGAMPSSISISATPVSPRRRIAPSAQATSNRLWLATPTSSPPAAAPSSSRSSSAL